MLLFELLRVCCHCQFCCLSCCGCVVMVIVTVVDWVVVVVLSLSLLFLYVVSVGTIDVWFKIVVWRFLSAVVVLSSSLSLLFFELFLLYCHGHCQCCYLSCCGWVVIVIVTVVWVAVVLLPLSLLLFELLSLCWCGHCHCIDVWVKIVVWRFLSAVIVLSSSLSMLLFE